MGFVNLFHVSVYFSSIIFFPTVVNFVGDLSLLSL